MMHLKKVRDGTDVSNNSEVLACSSLIDNSKSSELLSESTTDIPSQQDGRKTRDGTINDQNSSNGEDSSSEKDDRPKEESWVTLFIDVIYVATIYSIGLILGDCRPEFKVYVITFSYFSIMFISRLSFDIYSIENLVKDNMQRRILFFFFCVGVYIMTLNIKLIAEEGYGVCLNMYDYDIGLAAGFLFTRLTLIFLHFKKLLGKKLGSNESNKHVEQKEQKEKKQEQRKDEEEIKEEEEMKDEKKENLLVNVLMILTFACRCIVMLFASGNYSSFFVFSVAASVEIFGCRCALLASEKVEEHQAKDLQTRLGLFFLLILGEAMLGLFIKNYNIDRKEGTYVTIM